MKLANIASRATLGYKRGSNCCPERRTSIRIDYPGSTCHYRSRSRRQSMGRGWERSRAHASSIAGRPENIIRREASRLPGSLA